MSKKLFTNEEIELLLKNKYVKNVTSKGIIYTDEFRKIFISENNNGKFPRQIFEECGFDIDILVIQRVHSDQGAHYTSPKFQKKVKSIGLRESMPRRGNYWDNAPQESFFGHFKDEVNFKNCNTLDDLESEINEYMDYYNNYIYQWN